MSLLFSFLILLLTSFKAYANPLACAVCTVAIASGLGISRLLGVDDMLIGIWVGAMLLALSQWTVFWLEKKNIKNIFAKILCYAGWYALIIPLYLGKEPSIVFNFSRIFGIDRFIFSIILGSFILFGSVKLYYYLKECNGGKPHFPFEKVVFPIASLFVASFIIYLITKG